MTINHDQLTVSEPLFLVGAERSGTTLLRLMLNHNPQVSWCQEFEYSVDMIADDGTFPDLNKYYEWLETHRIFQARNFKIDPNLNYVQLVNSFLLQQKERDHKKLIGATVHHHFDRLIKIWTEARFIHLIRDGRDVARSCIGMGWAGNVWTGVERWLEAEQLWESLQQTILPERYIEIYYEDLITQPQETLTKICHFIGISYAPKMLSYPDDTTYETPNPKLIQQWRHKLSQAEIQLIESRIADVLEKRGYELSGFPLIKVSNLQQKQLRLQDWWSRVQFRVKRFGLLLFIEDYLARKSKIKPWQRKVKQKTNEISKRYLK
ncbi:MAG TPA: sulfotransferase [Cyanothece sp. UBA12306]|nr:sulfotransferase [Cyanothece sp. UBA12306]